MMGNLSRGGRSVVASTSTSTSASTMTAMAAVRRMMSATMMSATVSSAVRMTKSAVKATTQTWTRGIKKVAVGAGGKTKTKIKPYSSYKGRFKLTGSGKKVLRKHKGRRHCAFAKTPKQRRQLRASTLVHESLLQPMRKLAFK